MTYFEFNCDCEPDNCHTDLPYWYYYQHVLGVTSMGSETETLYVGDGREFCRMSTYFTTVWETA